MNGRVYRRCGCRSIEGKQVGARCPALATNDKHGTWHFAVDLPSMHGKRITMRRGGFTTRRQASKALRAVTDRVQTSVRNDDKETVGDYLAKWLRSQRHALKPKTLHQYGQYVQKDLVPALGEFKLEALRHEHIAATVLTLEKAGRGPATIKQVLAVLRSALGHAVKTKRLSHNPAEHVRTPRVERTEVCPWSADQAVMFLDHVGGDRPAEFFEVLTGTGLRRGEALALHWEDVDLDQRVLHVRRSVTDVGGKLTIGTPKTKGSATGVGLSARVVAALERQRERQVFEVLEWGDGYEHHGLVFAKENGTMLRPEFVLKRFHALTDTAGLPRVRIHDLRHLAATLMLTNGVPLALVSKTLRHSQVGITANLYGHLTPEAAHAAADSLGGVLDAAAAKLVADRSLRGATTLRPHRPI